LSTFVHFTHVKLLTFSHIYLKIKTRQQTSGGVATGAHQYCIRTGITAQRFSAAVAAY
jgi:hypothetical protein